MICLLCYEPNEESIVLDSEDGRRLNVPQLLFKYFQFCFAFEPTDGDVCMKCWQKTVTFHEFHVQIETVHETLNQNRPTTVKSESNDLIRCESTFVEDLNWSFADDFSNGSGDFQNETKTGTAEPIWLPTDLKPNDIVDVKFEGPSTEGPQKCLNQTKTKTRKRKYKKRATKKPELKVPINFVCKIKNCMEDFKSKEALIAHKTIAHRRIQCTNCPDQKLVVDLNKHLREVHGIIQNSICEICGQVYTNTRSLQEHIQRKHQLNVISDPLQCDICKEWFKNRDTIRAHMSYVHVQGPQPCTVCGKVSANRKALRKHMTIHLESWKDRFKCIICGRGFRDNTKLKEHSYIHSGVTDAYECNFCGKNFRFGSSLSAHRMKYHPAEMAHVKDRLQRKKNLEFKV